jgi:hypothetical protein
MVPVGPFPQEIRQQMMSYVREIQVLCNGIPLEKILESEAPKLFP